MVIPGLPFLLLLFLNKVYVAQAILSAFASCYNVKECYRKMNEWHFPWVSLPNTIRLIC
jgi:hypothetical protein